MGAVLSVLFGKDPREPLLGRASLTAMFALAAAFGVRISADKVNALVTVALFVLPAGAALVTAWLARKKVTPVAAPKSPAGAPLVAVTDTVTDAAGGVLGTVGQVLGDVGGIVKGIAGHGRT